MEIKQMFKKYENFTDEELLNIINSQDMKSKEHLLALKIYYHNVFTSYKFGDALKLILKSLDNTKRNKFLNSLENYFNYVEKFIKKLNYNASSDIINDIKYKIVWQARIRLLYNDNKNNIHFWLNISETKLSEIILNFIPDNFIINGISDKEVLFKCLFLKYANKTCKRAFYKGLNVHNADDVCQESFEGFFKSFDCGGFDKSREFIRFFNVIVRNNLNKSLTEVIYKCESSLNEKILDDGEIEKIDLIESYYTQPEELVVKNSAHKSKLATVVYSNTNLNSETVQLKIFENLSYKEILEKRDLPVTNNAIDNLRHQKQHGLQEVKNNDTIKEIVYSFDSIRFKVLQLLEYENYSEEDILLKYKLSGRIVETEWEIRERKKFCSQLKEQAGIDILDLTADIIKELKRRAIDDIGILAIENSVISFK